MSLYRIEDMRSDDLIPIPIMGAALCAGCPSPADDFLGGALELLRWLAPNPPATFASNISGDSMRGAGIFDRDLAVVDRRLKAGHGSVVVAAVDGEMSIERRLIEGNVARLAFDRLNMRTDTTDAARREPAGTDRPARSRAMLFR